MVFVALAWAAECRRRQPPQPPPTTKLVEPTEGQRLSETSKLDAFAATSALMQGLSGF